MFTLTRAMGGSLAFSLGAALSNSGASLLQCPHLEKTIILIGIIIRALNNLDYSLVTQLRDILLGGIQSIHTFFQQISICTVLRNIFAIVPLQTCKEYY